MKSPFTGGNATIHHEIATMKFRKEEFQYINTYYVCDDTQVPFTVEGMDNVHMAQVLNQYRVKYGIPFADEISKLRESYGLSAIKMSTILGFGDNQYRLYEGGEMPSLSNGRILKSIINPAVFCMFVESAKAQLSERDYIALNRKIEEKEKSATLTDAKLGLVYGNGGRCAANGYAEMSLQKLRNIILYFIEHCDNVFNTKMNKLLFYLDMLAYRESGIAMTGLTYKAIQFGPVPVRWDRVYSMIDGIEPEIVTFESGAQGVKLSSMESANIQMFTTSEQRWLEMVAERFALVSSADISQISHDEEAWQNAFEKGCLVSFDDAFLLKAI